MFTQLSGGAHCLLRDAAQRYRTAPSAHISGPRHLNRRAHRVPEAHCSPSRRAPPQAGPGGCPPGSPRMTPRRWRPPLRSCGNGGGGPPSLAISPAACTRCRQRSHLAPCSALPAVWNEEVEGVSLGFRPGVWSRPGEDFPSSGLNSIGDCNLP